MAQRSTDPAQPLDQAAFDAQFVRLGVAQPSDKPGVLDVVNNEGEIVMHMADPNYIAPASYKLVLPILPPCGEHTAFMTWLPDEISPHMFFDDPDPDPWLRDRRPPGPPAPTTDDHQ
jgi:hypothetical protein